MAQVRVFFVLAFALTWTVGGVGLLLGAWMPGFHPLSTSSPLYYLAGYAVSAVGLGLSGRLPGRAGVRDLGRRLIPWRSPAG